MFILYHHITAYSSAVKFTRLIPGNVCLQTDGMLKPIKSVAPVDPAPYSKNTVKNEIVKLNCQPLLLGENYFEIKAWHLKFA